MFTKFIILKFIILKINKLLQRKQIIFLMEMNFTIYCKIYKINKQTF